MMIDLDSTTLSCGCKLVSYVNVGEDQEYFRIDRHAPGCENADKLARALTEASQ